jgi:putative membrane protein
MATFILPTISTSFIALSAIFVAVGWVSIRKGNREAHQKWMTVGSVLATLFFLTYVSRTAFVGNTKFGGPDDVKVYYQIFLVFHIVLATVAAVMGLITLYRAYKKQFDRHKRIGPWTAIIWFVTAITGVTVYVLLYVLYPGGTQDSVIKVILGW